MNLYEYLTELVHHTVAAYQTLRWVFFFTDHPHMHPPPTTLVFSSCLEMLHADEHEATSAVVA